LRLAESISQRLTADDGSGESISIGMRSLLNCDHNSLTHWVELT